MTIFTGTLVPAMIFELGFQTSPLEQHNIGIIEKVSIKKGIV